jgi:hypothetical protein
MNQQIADKLYLPLRWIQNQKYFTHQQDRLKFHDLVQTLWENMQLHNLPIDTKKEKDERTGKPELNGRLTQIFGVLKQIDKFIEEGKEKVLRKTSFRHEELPEVDELTEDELSKEGLLTMESGSLFFRLSDTFCQP